MEPKEVETAFAVLEREPENVQAILRHILLRAISNPEVMQALKEERGPLVPYFKAVCNTLERLVTMPRPCIGTVADLEDVAVESGLRDVKEGLDFLSENKEMAAYTTALLSVVGSLRDSEEKPLSLLTLARLTVIGWEDQAFVEHVVKGNPIEEFL